MSDHHAPEARLLAESERDLLADPEKQPDGKREELISQLGDRLSNTFGDIELLYTVLTEDEIKTLFGGSDDARTTIRAQAHHVFTFLYYGLQQTGDDVRFRIAGAIEAAEAANNRDATVTLDVTTQPFLPPAQQVEALKSGAPEQVSVQALDRLWYDDQVPPADVVDVYAALGEPGLTVEDIVAAREDTVMVERMPAPVITDINVTSGPPVEDDT